ncbi:hypothetical protein SAMN05216266_12262 [Amycolatopsis marina]|uniref:Secreted protein n=1 Tax=Amycolatopsis marina TaxID=490629 RepID=A0A1I1C9C8_9PSEU|nr:hypothetical protein [Amycolatopsis marina]SFB58626.1 hypothetical protein SAMN05216266_12262 [Amycolatopsis marina]
MVYRRIVFLGAASALLVAAGAGTAAAAATGTAGVHRGDVCTQPSQSCSGSASFVRHGEHLYIWDNAGEGRQVAVEYERSDVSQKGQAWNARGFASEPTDHNMNMPENATIKYRVCLGVYDADEGTRYINYLSCSAWKTERAS